MSKNDDSDAAARYQVATFAAGCFWHVEHAFHELPGVVGTEVGYTGGHMEHPTYEDVCSHTTGHAEAVQVTFDPDRITYDELLAVFWRVHDPTQRDGQGLDIGDNYRSVIFFHTEVQRDRAEVSRDREQLPGTYGDRAIVTEIIPMGVFWRAEEYHQGYVEKHGGDAVC
jgi:peptide-methionine (S)-S-oxide reductase